MCKLADAPPPLSEAFIEFPLTVMLIEPDTPYSAFWKSPEYRFAPVRTSCAVCSTRAEAVAQTADMWKVVPPRLRKLARHLAFSELPVEKLTLPPPLQDPSRLPGSAATGGAKAALLIASAAKPASAATDFEPNIDMTSLYEPDTQILNDATFYKSIRKTDDRFANGNSR